MNTHLLSVLALCGSSLALQAQSQTVARDPHLPPAAVVPSLDQYVVVDDMLLWPEQLALMTAPVTARKQGAPFAYGFRVGAWDAGVIPYEIAPGFSPAQRQRILDAMALWGPGCASCVRAAHHAERVSGDHPGCAASQRATMAPARHSRPATSSRHKTRAGRPCLFRRQTIG
jgi:hypothetical protein